MAGFGSSSFGTGPYGVGTPITVDSHGKRRLIDDAGEPQNARKINPVTKDYELDDYGRFKGMSGTQQCVLMAVSTDYGSAAVSTMGNKLRDIVDITETLERQVDQVYREALTDLVNRRRIEIISITTERLGNSGAFARVHWRDLSNLEEHETLA